MRTVEALTEPRRFVFLYDKPLHGRTSGTPDTVSVCEARL